jgi:hypothetical protein
MSGPTRTSGSIFPARPGPALSRAQAGEAVAATPSPPAAPAGARASAGPGRAGKIEPLVRVGPDMGAAPPQGCSQRPASL